jgi:VanZ family protein
MSRVIRWTWVWGPAVAVMAAIFYASSLPDLWAFPRGLPDEIAHFAGYALLGGLLLRALAGAHVTGVDAPTAWRALAIGVAYGASDEGHQFFVRGRTPAIDDLAADAFGVAVAVAVCWVVTEAVRRHRAGSREV